MKSSNYKVRRKLDVLHVHSTVVTYNQSTECRIRVDILTGDGAYNPRRHCSGSCVEPILCQIRLPSLRSYGPFKLTGAKTFQV